MAEIPQYPVKSFVRPESVQNGQLLPGAEVWIKKKSVPADTQWDTLVVWEYLGPGVRRQKVLAVVPVQRDHRTIAVTDRPAVFQNVRAALIHHLRRGPPNDQDSTPLGNGNGCTPIVIAPGDEP